MTNNIEEIRERMEKATKGPAIWRNFGSDHLSLVTTHSGALIIMDSVRIGMQGATFRFRNHEKCLMERVTASPNHPDAIFINNAYTDIPFLLNHIEKLQNSLDILSEEAMGADL